MKIEEWDALAKRIFMYYQRKQPDSYQLTLWFNKIRFVPGVAAQYIYDYITDQRDRMPTNLPKEIKAGWSGYLRDNPNKAAKFEKKPCPDCGGRGLLTFKRFDALYGADHEFSCPCGSCQNFLRHFATRGQDNYAVYTRRQLEDLGYKIWPYKDYPPVTPQKVGGTDGLAEDVGVPF